MRGLRSILLALVALGVAGAVGWWWYTTTRPEARLRAGQEALRHDDPERAERLAARLEASGYPSHAALLRGEALLRRQEFARALAEFNRIEDQGEVRLEAAALSGQCLLHLNLREAEAAFRFVVEQRPDHLAAHRGLADVYYFQGALMQAAHHLEEVARLDPEDGRAHRFLGLIYKDLGQHEPACAHYDEAFRRTLADADAEQARAEWAECLLAQHQHARALEVLESCRSADAPAVLAVRAECLWQLGETSRARDLLDRALASDPRPARLLRLRGRVHLADKEPAKAVTLLKQAVDLDRHDPTSRLQLALAYRQLDRSADADEQERWAEDIRRDLDALTQLNREAMARPWDAAVRRRLAELCRKLDRPEEAQMWLKAAAACPSAP
jgi:tetratricopeptide (TPR) repeat protein